MGIENFIIPSFKLIEFTHTDITLSEIGGLNLVLFENIKLRLNFQFYFPNWSLISFTFPNSIQFTVRPISIFIHQSNLHTYDMRAVVRTFLKCLPCTQHIKLKLKYSRFVLLRRWYSNKTFIFLLWKSILCVWYLLGSFNRKPQIIQMVTAREKPSLSLNQCTFVKL